MQADPSPHILILCEQNLTGTRNQLLGVAQALQSYGRFTQHLYEFSLSPLQMIFPALIRIPDLDRPTLILAAGRKSLFILKALKKKWGQTRPFTVFLQDPRGNHDLFDLVVMPYHDPKPSQNNVTIFQTWGAPNRIIPDELNQHRPLLKPIIDSWSGHGHKVAICIGGKSKHHDLPPPLAHKMAQRLLDLANRADVSGLMITLSRRTPPKSAAIFQQILSHHPKIYLWDGKGENPYFSMLAWADIMMVTNDSVSMISESLSTGKPLYILPLTGRSRKIESFIKSMITQGRARLFDDGQLEIWEYAPLNEAARVAAAVVNFLNTKDTI